MSPTDAERDRDGTLWITTVHYATLYSVHNAWHPWQQACSRPMLIAWISQGSAHTACT